jgi:hypothetical protein
MVSSSSNNNFSNKKEKHGNDIRSENKNSIDSK